MPGAWQVLACAEGRHLRFGPLETQEHAASVLSVLQAKAAQLQGKPGWQAALGLEAEWMEFIAQSSWPELLADLGAEEQENEAAVTVKVEDIAAGPVGIVEAAPVGASIGVPLPLSAAAPVNAAAGQAGAAANLAVQEHCAANTGRATAAVALAAGAAAGEARAAPSLGGTVAGGQGAWLASMPLAATPQQGGDADSSSSNSEEDKATYRCGRLIGTGQPRGKNGWQTHIHVAVDRRGRPVDQEGRSFTILAGCKTQPEAAVARDLAVIWLRGRSGRSKLRHGVNASPAG